MKLSMRKYYRKWEPFERYGITNKKRAREIEHVYSLNRKYFGKRILDVACGGGILGFLVEQRGHSYTGIDVNPDMIKSATSYATLTGSGCKFILGDIRNKTVMGKFDTITCLGNSISHLTSKEFLGILEGLNGNATKGTYFIVDYRDTVDLLFRKAWRDRLRETYNGTAKTIITTGCDTVEGEICQDALVKGKLLMKAKQTIWSPFILEPLMESNGWNLVERKKSPQWRGWLDIYTRRDH